MPIKIKEKKEFYWENLQDVNFISELLQHNHVGICATDTVYGFLGALTQQAANKINSLKGDRKEKPYIVLIADISKLQKFVASETVSQSLLNLLKKTWPGPLTVIFKAQKNLPPFLVSKEQTIALRCPKHDGLLTLLKNFDGLFSTSANRGGDAAPTKKENIDKTLLDDVAFFIDSKEVIDKELPSTILDATKENLRLVRQGEYSLSELERIYGKKIEQ